MRSTTLPSLLFISAVAALGPRVNAAPDNSLSLVVNPRTGTASIRNDTATTVEIDGYLLTAASSAFNPASWATLSGSAAYPGWALGPSEPNRLGEASLLSSLGVGGGMSLSLGSPYLPQSPTQIGQPEVPFKFEYHVAGGQSFVGDVVFSPQNGVVLMVNPATGLAWLQNQSMFDVNIDALLIKSPANVLDPVGWNGFAEAGIVGWTAGASETNRLAEGNLFGSRLLPHDGALVPIGTPINPAMIQDETDLEFEYHVSGGGTLQGSVVFQSAAITPLAGDYNGNGKVDAADYTIWRNTLGSTTDLRANGDDTGSSTGKIDQADYVVWKKNFGAANGTGSSSLFGTASTALPEPGTGLMSCLFGLAITLIRRCQRSDH